MEEPLIATNVEPITVLKSLFHQSRQRPERPANSRTSQIAPDPWNVLVGNLQGPNLIQYELVKLYYTKIAK